MIEALHVVDGARTEVITSVAVADSTTTLVFLHEGAPTAGRSRWCTPRSTTLAAMTEFVRRVARARPPAGAAAPR